MKRVWFSVTCIFISLFSLQLSYAAAPFNASLGSHPLQQITTDRTGATSVDANSNGIIDTADVAIGFFPNTSIGDGTSNAVLRIKGATTLWSAIDLFSGSTEIWGIGRNQNDNKLYIDRSGIARVITIDPSSLNIGIGTTNPTAAFSAHSSVTQDATGILVDRSGGGANGASATQKGIYVIQRSSNDATSNIGIESYVIHNLGNGGSFGVKGEAHNVYGRDNIQGGPSAGLYGIGHKDNSHGPGAVIGVLGETSVTDNPSGYNGQSYAGYFHNKFGNGAQNYGVYITGGPAITGLYVDKSSGGAYSPLTTQKGIYVNQRSSNNAAVNIGIDSEVTHNLGNPGNFGVKGTAHGVYGGGQNAGVYGVGHKDDTNGYGTVIGVWGQTVSNYNPAGQNGASYAGYFTDNADSAIQHGIYISTRSNSAYGIYQDGGANIYFSGQITGPSDIRLKKEIVPLNNALSNLGKLEGVSFIWKNSNDTSKHFGVVAQEVRKVYPELVDTNKEGYYTVNYDGLIPVLVQAINELNAQVQEQQKTIELQQKQIEELQ